MGEELAHDDLATVCPHRGIERGVEAGEGSLTRALATRGEAADQVGDLRLGSDRDGKKPRIAQPREIAYERGLARARRPLKHHDATRLTREREQLDHATMAHAALQRRRGVFEKVVSPRQTRHTPRGAAAELPAHRPKGECTVCDTQRHRTPPPQLENVKLVIHCRHTRRPPSVLTLLPPPTKAEEAAGDRDLGSGGESRRAAAREDEHERAQLKVLPLRAMRNLFN